MATRRTPSERPLAEAPDAGPAERELRPTRSGATVETNVQRCLRCDALLVEHSPLYPAGTRIATAPSGGRMKRYVLDDRPLRDGETDCIILP